MQLTVLDTTLAVCRLPVGPLPSWFSFDVPLTAAVVRAGELTLVAPSEAVPDGVQAAHGWSALEVDAVLDFSVTGVMADLAGALARAGVSLFAVSTHDTDVLLVQDLAGAVAALRGAGHEVAGGPTPAG